MGMAGMVDYAARLVGGGFRVVDRARFTELYAVDEPWSGIPISRERRDVLEFEIAALSVDLILDREDPQPGRAVEIADKMHAAVAAAIRAEQNAIVCQFAFPGELSDPAASKGGSVIWRDGAIWSAGPTRQVAVDDIFHANEALRSLLLRDLSYHEREAANRAWFEWMRGVSHDVLLFVETLGRPWRVQAVRGGAGMLSLRWRHGRSWKDRSFRLTQQWLLPYQENPALALSML